MSILICGSRDPRDPFQASMLCDQIVQRLPAGMVVLNGGARGVDELVLNAVRTRPSSQVIELGTGWLYPGRIDATVAGVYALVFRPNYKRDGKAAPIIRNLHMLDLAPEMVIAVHNGVPPGTRHVVEEARRRGLETVVMDA